MRGGYSTAFAEGFDIPAHVIADFDAMTYTSYDDTAKYESQYVAQRPFQERLAPLNIPLLDIQGAADQLVDPLTTEAFAQVPGARIALLPGGVGHSPQIERPAEVVRLLRDFVPAR